MNIGIFGDSFADPTNRTKGKYDSWMTLLSQSLSTEYKTYGHYGTSHWWSYEQFLQNYKKHDTIVFCHTRSSRWPHLPDHMIGEHWHVGHFNHNDIHAKDLLKILPAYKYVFTEELLNFISTNIFTSVNNLCREEGIYLVNMMCYGDGPEQGGGHQDSYPLINTEFPIYKNMDGISALEECIINGERVPIIKILQDRKLPDMNRSCHYNPENHKRLTAILKDTIENKKTNIFSDLVKDFEWSTFDEELNNIYGK